MIKHKYIYNIITQLIVMCLLISNSHATRHEVGMSYSIKTISDAISQADDYDTLLISKGNYLEYDLLIDKPLTLIGKEFPVIDGQSNGFVMTVNSHDVNISGIHFKGSKVSFVEDFAALLIEDSYNCNIIGNKFSDNFFALYLSRSYNCNLFKNELIGNALTEPSSGNGIHLWYCKNIIITDNVVSQQRDGIYLEFVKNSTIKNNRSFNNLRYGLHFMYSDSCKYSHNIFTKNGAGVAVMYTKYVEMLNNRFEQNYGAASYGLLLKDITDSKVSNNRFYHNSNGIYIENSNRVVIENNDFIENGWGMKIRSSSTDNLITHNNFISNSFQVAASGRQNASLFSENYWSDYNGYDLDKNGFGDVPFRPVNLFSLEVERHPPTIILLHSLFADMLNLVEKIIPTLTPETLVDEKPLMTEINL